ncbi:type II toxin-antitoxin system prevent-host-death family antitoxin [Methylobacterium sp. NEAU 140]|uniref:type II toxin-antitoxin system prevent-host-death family antitoxin n=1 Tax=Methylobacterium sp. NEAU 140 TaxID=3064945 RepID=UPI0027353B20|nr:type II toxin-antitoxin system prevent-host-death family antitoxin [Methylobacterium sp. NEAU 140]MDP4024531.1 type II toxin-antitoxin system prevent-host-death family antitoxin [Methylobacterium sp. NEAU 140]
MPVTTLSSRDFRQNANRAQKAAENGPVFITERGEPTQVLLNIEEYRRLTSGRRNLAAALSMPGLTEVPLEHSELRGLPRTPDLS